MIDERPSSVSLRRLGAVLAALVIALAAPMPSRAVGQASREDVRRVDREAREAYQSKDYPAFLQASRRLVEIAPRSTRALYNLACAAALSGEGGEALSALERLQHMGAFFDVASDDDLASLRADARFEAVAERMNALREPVVRATEAGRLEERDLLTEGIAYDPRAGDFFVSSVHRRKVVRIAANGSESDFVAEGADGLRSSVGLAIDPGRRSLYVSSVGTPYARGLAKEEAGKSEVLEYGLDDRRLRRRVAPPGTPDGASVSDIALGPDGVLFASDPASGGVYTASREEGSFRVLVPPGRIGSAQGITVSPDGRMLFVSDYTSGIWRILPGSGEARLLDAPENAALTGIDGLVYYRGSLIGIRNGFRPHAILRLGLAPERDRIARVDVLERADPRWDEPTLGVVAGDAFVYVARSQYQRFSDAGVPGSDLEPPLLLRLALDW